MSHAPYYHPYPMVAYQLHLRPFRHLAEGDHHPAHMAVVEEGRTDLEDAVISATAEEEEEGDMTKEGWTEVCHRGNGEEAKHRRIESQVLAEDEEEVTAVTGVVEEGEDGSPSVLDITLPEPANNANKPVKLGQLHNFRNRSRRMREKFKFSRIDRLRCSRTQSCSKDFTLRNAALYFSNHPVRLTMLFQNSIRWFKFFIGYHIFELRVRYEATATDMFQT
jgi:hypothetical protein